MNEDDVKLNPQELFRLYRQGGKKALTDALCVFGDHPSLNDLMEELVELLTVGFAGQIPVEKFVDQVGALNEKIHDAICDLTLDHYNDGSLEKEEMTGYLDKLNETKAKSDSKTKDNT